MRHLTPAQLRRQVERAWEMWGHIINPIEEEFGFPRGLMYAIGSRETNLDPYYAHNPGDEGWGHGIWQIDKGSHTIPPDWRGNIEWQCRKGAEVLLGCFRRCGSWEGAGNCYNSGRCSASATTGGDYGPDVMERLEWVQQFLDELSPKKPEPDFLKEEIQMLMFWHRQSIFLDFHGRISPWGLHPSTVDGLLAAGVRIVGKPGDDSELFRMFAEQPVSDGTDGGLVGRTPPEYPADFLERNGWLRDYLEATRR